MPQEWETGMVINIYKKNKKQMWKLQRNSFVAHSLQTTHKYIKKQVEEQCGFRKERSFTDAIFTMQQIIKKKGTQLTAISFIYRL